MKSALEELQAVIERLTDAENGCPWDKEQTPESLTEYLIEESHELVSAIRSGNTADVCEELGDVAFLLLFVAHLYQKRGQFSLDDALNNNRAKMVRRHPHVFGDVTFDNLDEQLKTWEKIKRAEHTDAEGKPQGLFDSLPSSLPPLTKAYRIHSKAARVGFTWPEDEEVEQQVEAEWLEWLDASAGDDAEAQKHELGDLIFSITEMGRRKGIKASEALDLATARFLRRFARMEELARQQGKDFPDLSLDEKDELWNAAKEEERPPISDLCPLAAFGGRAGPAALRLFAGGHGPARPQADAPVRDRTPRQGPRQPAARRSRLYPVAGTPVHAGQCRRPGRRGLGLGTPVGQQRQQ